MGRARKVKMRANRPAAQIARHNRAEQAHLNTSTGTCRLARGKYLVADFGNTVPSANDLGDIISTPQNRGYECSTGSPS